MRKRTETTDNLTSLPIPHYDLGSYSAEYMVYIQEICFQSSGVNNKKSPVVFPCMDKVVQNKDMSKTALAVSYTHLDVYKRQPLQL